MINGAVALGKGGRVVRMSVKYIVQAKALSMRNVKGALPTMVLTWLNASAMEIGCN